MPDVVPAGSFSLPLRNLRTLIATTSAFQTWVGAGDVAEAEARAYEIAEKSSGVTRPFALLEFGGVPSRFEAVADGPNFGDAGTLVITFVNSLLGDYDDDDFTNQIYKFTNDVGGIVDEMLTLARTAGFLMVTEMEVIDGPAFSEIQKPNPYVWARYQVTWDIFG